MILAVDIGNTNIVIAMYSNGMWTNTFRYETKENQPEFFYENSLRNIFLEWKIIPSTIKRIVVSSVVPDLNALIVEAIRNVTGHHAMILQPDIYKLLPIHVPHPYDIGSDIVSNAYAALELYGNHCIVVDFGTAISFTVCDKTNGITGVTIAPGLKTAMQSLVLNTAQLPVVPLDLPKSAIGHDTTSAIQAGVLWGYVGLVKELLHKIQSEKKEKYKVVATGGLSSILHPLEGEFDVVSKILTLDGMRMIYEWVDSEQLIVDN